jgi:hypothetical protein
MKKSELKAFIKEEIKANLSEGVWSVMPERIPEFIQKVKDLMEEYHAVVGSDDVFDGLDRAIQGAKDLMAMRNEATIETSPEDLAKVKAVAKPDDVIKVTEAADDEDYQDDDDNEDDDEEYDDEDDEVWEDVDDEESELDTNNNPTQ